MLVANTWCVFASLVYYAIFCYKCICIYSCTHEQNVLTVIKICNLNWINFKKYIKSKSGAIYINT